MNMDGLKDAVKDYQGNKKAYPVKTFHIKMLG